MVFVKSDGLHWLVFIILPSAAFGLEYSPGHEFSDILAQQGVSWPVLHDSGHILIPIPIPVFF